MSPTIRWSAERLAAIGPALCVPPGPPEGFTTLFETFGLTGFLDEQPLSTLALSSLLATLGHPERPTEEEALLWVTPLPTSGIQGAFESLARHPNPAVRAENQRMIRFAGGDERLASLGIRDPHDDVAKQAWLTVASHGYPKLAGSTATPEAAAATLKHGESAAFATEASTTDWLEQHDFSPVVLTAALHHHENPPTLWLEAALQADRPEFSYPLVELARSAGRHRAAIDWIEELAAGSWIDRALAMAACQTAPPSSRIEALVAAHLDHDDQDVAREAALANHQAIDRLMTRRAGFFHRAHATSDPAVALRWLTTRMLDDRVRAAAALYLGYHEPALAHELLDTMVQDIARTVPLPLRKWCAAAHVLTDATPSIPALNRILLTPSAPPLPDPTLIGIALTDPDPAVRAHAIAQAELPEELARYAAARDLPNQRLLQASSRWLEPTDASALAQLATEPSHAGLALQRLARSRPELATSLARHALATDERTLTAPAARILMDALTPEEREQELAQALAALTSDSWLAREKGALLLGSAASCPLAPGRAEELAEALTSLATEDLDADVRSAAAAAVGALS